MKLVVLVKETRERIIETDIEINGPDDVCPKQLELLAKQAKADYDAGRIDFDEDNELVKVNVEVTVGAAIKKEDAEKDMKAAAERIAKKVVKEIFSKR